MASISVWVPCKIHTITFTWKELAMPKGYLVAHIRVHDAEGFKKFAEMAMPAIAEYGGKVLVRNPNPEVREGSDSGLVIVIEFESIENARNFYESSEYTAAKAVRELAADCSGLQKPDTELRR